MFDTLIAIFGLLCIVEVFHYIIKHYSKECIPAGVKFDGLATKYPTQN